MNSRKNLSTGFTLLEMMVVLFIVGMIAGMAIPRMAGMRGAKLRRTTRQLAATIGYVYEIAILKKTNFRICFDLEESSYWIEERAGEEYFQSSDVLLQAQVLPQEVYFRKVLVMDREAGPEEDVCIYYTPYGYVEDATIQLEVEGGSSGYTLLTDAMTGKAIIYEGFVEREE
jgi:prepilin-type N-terminal cleavage/methylation domain-containing protein